MAYRYGLRNAFRPTLLAPNAYGWSTAPGYNRADVPTALMDQPSNITAEQFAQQFAYEWFQSGTWQPGFPSSQGYTNPPFVSGAAGRLLPSLTTSGMSPRILRGYIRRASYEAGDFVSKARLYFMYNPEQITRDYVSYLEQGALDPFNTVYQSGNLVAPPSILDFSFELFFDRQEEATAPDHPGVYVDYQFFDLVVRNVVPSNPNQSSNTLPDNGVMMVNPRNITVVFSPQFTVEGRPLNARVTFEKFTHRMVPIRMRIALTMRAVYMGPIKDMVEYKAEEFAAEAAIPLDEIKAPEYIINITQAKIAEAIADGVTTAAGAISDAVNANYTAQSSLSGGASSGARAAALQWAIGNVTNSTIYTQNSPARHSPPASADCSGLVASAYNAIGHGQAMNWADYPGTAVIHSRLLSDGGKTAQRLPIPKSADEWAKLQPGDLLFRIKPHGHIKFFVKMEGSSVKCFDAASSSSNPQVGFHNSSMGSHADYEYVIRPIPLGADMSYNTPRNGPQ